MAVPEVSVEYLLRQLSDERTLPGRLRLLARSWKLLEALSPLQRQRVALGVGSKFAWRHLEKLLRRDGALSESDLVVKRALQAVGSADPAELRQLAVAVRSGDRQRAGRSINKLLELAIVEEADEADSADRWREAAEPVPQARIEDAEAAESQPQAVEIHAVAPAPEAVSGVKDARVPSPPAAPIDAGPSVAAIVPPAVAVDPGASVDPIVPPAVAADTAATDVGLVAGAVAAVEKARPRRRKRRKAAPPRPTSQASEEIATPVAVHDALLVSQGTPGSVVDELAILRSLGGHGTAAFGRRERAELLASLGRDWTRRRALSRMIQSHAVADVSEALQLVELIESPSQRAWCLADVLALWELTESDRRRVLDAVPSEGARRRLAKRSARG